MQVSRIAITLVIVALLALVPDAGATPGVAGSQVLAGESDWIVPAKGNSRPFNVVYGNFGSSSSTVDDCLVLRTTTSSTAAHADYDGTTPSQTIKTKDIRLTECLGTAAGTQLVDSDVSELSQAWTFDPDLHAVYADVNHDGKYSKTDYLYLTTKTPVATAANAVDGMVATSGPTSWTVRLTPAGDLKGLTFVRIGDADFTSFQSAAQLLVAITGTNTLDAGTIQEREDGQWLWIPSGSSTFLLKGIIPPLDSIRLNTIAPSVPDIRVLGLDVATPEIVAGQNFNVIVEVTNAGKLAGNGIILSKIDGDIVDARLSPLLGAGEKASVLLTMKAKAGGAQNLAVNDIFSLIEVTGDPPADSAAGTRNAELEAKVQALEARLAALETSPASGGSDVQVQSAGGNAKSPGVDPLVFILLLVALALIRRRN